MPDAGEVKSNRQALLADEKDKLSSDFVDFPQKRLSQTLKVLVFALMAVYGGAFAATFASYLRQDISQMLIIATISFVLVVTLFGVLHIIKQEKMQTAAYLLLVITVTHMIAVQLALTGLFVTVVLSGVTLTLVLGNLILRSRWRLLLTTALFFIILCGVIELYSPIRRFDMTKTPLADVAVIFSTVVLLVVVIALSIRSTQFSTVRTRLLVSFTVITIIPGLLTVGIIMLDRAFGGQYIKSAVSAAWLILVVTTTSVLLSLIGAYFFAKGISRPLTEMVVMADSVSQGDLSQKIMVDRVDEIGKTALAFNAMTNQLRQIIGELEERVGARTADLERRTRLLEAVVKTSRQIAVIKDVSTLLQVAVTETAERLEYSFVSIYLYDDQRKALRLRAFSTHTGERLTKRDFTLDLDTYSIPATAVLNGTPLIVYDYDKQDQFTRLPEFPLIRSELALPLRVRGEIIGVIDIAHTQPEFFDEQDAMYLQTFADQLTLAIDNAILLASAEERLHEIERLISNQSTSGWQDLAIQRPNWGYIYDGSNVQPLHNQFMRSSEVDLEIPLVSDRSELGKIKIKLPKDRLASEKDLTLAQAIAKEAGQALESARLFTESQDTLQEVGVLYRAIQAVVSANTSEEVMAAFVNNLVTPGLDRCLLLMNIEEDTDSLRRYAKIEAAWDEGKEVSPVIGQVWDMRQIPCITSAKLVVTDIESSTVLDAVSKATLHHIGLRALMVVPLGIADDVFGWLLICAQTKPYTFTKRQIRLYGNFADQLTQALENIRLVRASENRAAEELLVRNLTQRVRETLSIDEVLQTAVVEMRKLLDLESVEIRLGDTDEGIQ